MDARTGITSIASARCASIGCTLCADLPPRVRQELYRLAHIRSYRAGETVLAAAEPVEFVGHVISGVLRMQKTLHDGRQQIVGLLLASDMFGRVFGQTAQVAVEAATEVTLCCYNRLSFEALFGKFPELEHRMLIATLHELDAAQDWMLLLATQSVPERVATFLLMLRRKAGSFLVNDATGVIEVPIARKDMAAYLGTTVESISRTIQQMAKRRIIRIIDPQRFEILDMRRLILLSGHDPEEFLADVAWRRYG